MHTPGPWTINEAKCHARVARNGTEEIPFFSVENPTYSAGGGIALVHIKASVEHSEGNARLIAAAPDLLLQLKSVLACIEIAGECFGDMDGIRAAIKKAESL